MSSHAASAMRPAVTVWNHVRAVLLLPFMNTVLIPGALLYTFRDAAIGRSGLAVELVASAIALVLLAVGLTLAIRTIGLFVRRGQGTLAPWDPTQVLITTDVYRFSRNPMKAGLFLILAGECVLLRSTALYVWAVCFMLVNALYIRLHEEQGLRKRFGDAYLAYCRQVPRWFPRLSMLRQARAGGDRPAPPEPRS